MLRRLPGPAALMLAVVLAGCGGGSYTQRDFVTRANAICASTLRHTRAVTPPSGTSGVALAGYLEQLLPVIRDEAAQLHALRRPPGPAAQRAQLTAFLRALDASVRQYARLAAAARRGDGSAVAQAEAALRASPVAELGARYGLSDCGTPRSTTA